MITTFPNATFMNISGERGITRLSHGPHDFGTPTHCFSPAEFTYFVVLDIIFDLSSLSFLFFRMIAYKNGSVGRKSKFMASVVFTLMLFSYMHNQIYYIDQSNH